MDKFSPARKKYGFLISLTMNAWRVCQTSRGERKRNHEANRGYDFFVFCKESHFFPPDRSKSLIPSFGPRNKFFSKSQKIIPTNKIAKLAHHIIITKKICSKIIIYGNGGELNPLRLNGRPKILDSFPPFTFWYEIPQFPAGKRGQSIRSGPTRPKSTARNQRIAKW